MKTIYSITLFLLIASVGFASPKITAVSNGNWNNNSSWDLNRVPASGDTVIIPAGKTITIVNNETPGLLYIEVYGTLKFNGGKLDIDNNSSILVYGGGKITSSGSSSEKIRIGNTEKYRGTDSDVIGAQMANQTTGSGFVGFSPLPVKFISFEVSKQSNNVLVEWITAEEVNSSYFQIERSLNGSDWTAIGTVNSSTNSNTIKSYSFIDKNISAKIIYYRIRQVDVDGKFVITPVRSIKMQNSNTEIKINAATNNSVIVYFSEEHKGNVLITVSSFSGQSISKQTLNNPVGQVMIETHAKSHGAYIVTVNDGNGLSVSKQILL